VAGCVLCEHEIQQLMHGWLLKHGRPVDRVSNAYTGSCKTPSHRAGVLHQTTAIRLSGCAVFLVGHILPKGMHQRRRQWHLDGCCQVWQSAPWLVTTDGSLPIIVQDHKMAVTVGDALQGWFETTHQRSSFSAGSTARGITVIVMYVGDAELQSCAVMYV